MTTRPAQYERRVLRDEIRDYLVGQILNGDLSPGDRITEMRVAQQFGVSQGPVREALRDLELFGFVVSEAFRGTRVRNVTNKDITEIYPIRASLEGVAARAAAKRITDKEIAELESLLGAMYDAADSGDRQAQMEANNEFHRTIVHASGNHLLYQFWERMHLTITVFLTLSRTDLSLQQLAERHRPLLEALRAHDPDQAEHAMRRHIEEIAEWIMANTDETHVAAGVAAGHGEQKEA